ncbi:hypothetical protein PB2503_08989 [Parvularcula bermudensis HTCC2503]|uniref:Lipid/polyisoprenoid-binding YceI-like domain-containing protein n=1 Tax=Parvularcula bermudensis (strain ATCC BAA-594 / HTCC2503 / KCTC 12087) TaxID=314260 RepID=E0TCR2_PARBH|nr:YceI family protein [Parvularcula bermudensis]ADM09851.1 hypothetical protein PB2503_08989 [Parvularcula bermudensis HTCC2503]
MNMRHRLSAGLAALALGVGGASVAAAQNAEPFLDYEALKASLADKPLVMNADHGAVGFVATSLIGSKVRGSFQDFTMTMSGGEGGQILVSAEFRVPTMEINRRRNLVMSEDFLYADRYDTITYRGALDPDSLIDDTPMTGVVLGELTLRGTSQPTQLIVDLTCDDIVDCPASSLVINGVMEINRQDFGITSMPGIVRNEIEIPIGGHFRPQVTD